MDVCGKVSYIYTLEKCCNVNIVVHVMHTTIAILRPFRSVSETEISILEVFEETLYIYIYIYIWKKKS